MNTFFFGNVLFFSIVIFRTQIDLEMYSSETAISETVVSISQIEINGMGLEIMQKNKQKCFDLSDKKYIFVHANSWSAGDV